MHLDVELVRGPSTGSQNYTVSFISEYSTNLFWHNPIEEDQDYFYFTQVDRYQTQEDQVQKGLLTS